MRQTGLFDKLEKKSSVENATASLPFKRIRDENFDVKDIPASTGIYGIHPYPAMFHFLVVRDLLKEYSREGNWVLDPFVGSGVVAGECLIAQRNFVGYDINPLAVLISSVRTTPIEAGVLLMELDGILRRFEKSKPEKVSFHNIHYWFTDNVIDDLSKLRQAILVIENEKVKHFFEVAFSETVRKVSRTKYNEFKLIRRKEENNLDVVNVFREIAMKNIGALTDFHRRFNSSKSALKIEKRNITDGTPLCDGSVDLVITSPPYGDSRTTVAYGQFSGLSLRWLGLEEDVDKISLGAKPKNIHHDLPSYLLYEFLEKIAIQDDRRAKEVFSFYEDLYNSIRIIARKVKKEGFVCFVVGNRKVKGIELPTDKISADFFEHQGFEHQRTIVRAISNKRMPIENSPSNIKGERDTTMRYEYIVIIRKT